MKFIIAIILLTGVSNLLAQAPTVNSGTYYYIIDLTTINENVLKGLLLQVKDSSILIYPGKRKQWKHHTSYASVEFGYNNIKQVKLKNKNGMLKGMLMGAGIGVSALAASQFFMNGNSKGDISSIPYTVLPAGIIIGAIIGCSNKIIFHIKGNKSAFNEFQKNML